MKSSVVCLFHVHDESGQSPVLLQGFSPFAVGEMKKAEGAFVWGGRVHDIISPGLLRSSPVEG